MFHPHIATITVLMVCACGDSNKGKWARPPASDPDIETDSDVIVVPPVLEFDGLAPSNVLMISIDTFRRDHMARYGGPGATPFLDELATAGVALDDHTSCSNWTYAATTCTVLGRSNVDNGFMPKFNGADREPLPENTPTLASWLGESGYYSILESHNQFLSSEWNNDQGYDLSTLHLGSDTSELFDLGLANLDDAIASGADKWFLHLHLMQPHAAYNPAPEYLTELSALDPIPWDLNFGAGHEAAIAEMYDHGQEMVNLVLAHLGVRYRGELLSMDDQIRAAFDDLDRRGLLDDTLVVFWTDHGEAFDEHGHMAHAWTLHRPENDSVLFFWAQNIEPDVWAGPTASTDMAPTILDVLGIDPAPEITGVPVGQASEHRARFAFSIARDGATQSIRKGNWKLIFNWRGEVETYDLDADPDEQNNLAEVGHAETQSLWDELQPVANAAVPLAPEVSITWPEGL